MGTYNNWYHTVVISASPGLVQQNLGYFQTDGLPEGKEMRGNPLEGKYMTMCSFILSWYGMVSTRISSVTFL